MAPPPAAPETHGLSLRSRLDAATMAILQTRDQVVRSLDKHLSELHSLRRALSEADSPLVSQSAPAISISAPPPQSELQTPVSVTILPPTPAPVMPKPVMTQVVWPSAQNAPAVAPATAERAAGGQLPLPTMPPPAVINALQGLQDVLLQKAPLTPPPMPVSAVFTEQLPALPEAPTVLQPAPVAASISPFELVPSQTTISPSQSDFVPQQRTPTIPQVPLSVAREATTDPKIDQATLEDLNAALAYAFSQAATPVQSSSQGGPMTSVMSQLNPAGLQQVTNQQWQLPPRH
ncbi:MAG: hypothetical protein JNJ83_14070 [Verrucomicrobiaceae bacterium]|nr:hypothetical protein [Verrucomicrobiaceae bacterium]